MLICSLHLHYYQTNKFAPCYLAFAIYASMVIFNEFAQISPQEIYTCYSHNYTPF